MIEISRPGNSDSATSTGPAARPTAISAPCSHDRRDAWLRSGSDVASAVALPGHPGHGSAAFLRKQLVRIVDGRIHGDCNGVYELICPNCGDHPDVDYSEVPQRLQRLRGLRTLVDGLAAYRKHLGIPWAEGRAVSVPARRRPRKGVSR